MKIKSSMTFGLLGILAFSIFAPWVDAQGITWKINPTPLPAPTFSHSSITFNGKIYLIGPYGGGGEESPNVYFADINLDGTVGSWHETTPLPEWRVAAATVVWNDFIYVAGGSGPVWGERGEQNTVYYASINSDGTIGDWSSTTLLPERIVGHKAVVWNGRIYVAGGWNGFSRQDKVYFAEINAADGSLGNWQTTTTLPLTLNQMCALAYDGAIYIIGGIHSQVPQSSVYYAFIDETYGTLGTWTTTSSLPEGRARVGCALVGDSLYVIGGHKGQEGGDNAPEKTVYKTAIEAHELGNWEELESIPEARREHSLVTFNGGIYVMGGRDIEMNPMDTIYYFAQPSVPPELPYWMQWWFWTIIGLCATNIISASFAFRYHQKTKSLSKTTKSKQTQPIKTASLTTCSNCGAQLPADAEFCGKCGTKLN